MTDPRPDSSVAERLLAMAARRSGVETLSYDPATPLTELGIDSLGLAELMFDIDDEFGVEIPDQQLLDLKNVGELVSLIETQLAGKASAA